MNRAWLEHQYLPSLSIPNAEAIFTQWKQRSTATRAKLAHHSDIAYGAHPREVMDYYPAAHPKGCVVYIHGGYWRAFSKFETSFVAEGFVEQGHSVALINYPLCPEVKIADIRASCARAIVKLYSVLSQAERRALVLTGHSAGGHLAAASLTQDLGLPSASLKGVISLSGVFDVAPLIQTPLNDQLHLDEPQAVALNLNKMKPLVTAPLALAVGGLESEEFHRQSSALAQSWAALKPQLIDITAANHFTIVDSLASQGAVLNRLAVAMAES